MQAEKWLLIPDCHVPYHDKKAFRLMLRAAKAAGIKNAAILGDFSDFYAVSSHKKDPRRRLNLQWEVDETSDALEEIEAVCPGKKKFIEGNHEVRLETYLMTKASELFWTVRYAKLLRLKERGWDFTPYRKATKIGKLNLTHDVGKHGWGCHRDALNAFQGNAVLGHCHKVQFAAEGNLSKKPHVAASFGWLGDFGQIDYMSNIRASRDWVHGFGTAYVEPSGNVHVVPHVIVDGKVLIEGKLVR